MLAPRIVLADDGVPIAAHDLGGFGANAVLVHATGFHAEVLGPLATGLGSELSCLAPDLRGHGLSGTAPGLDFSWGGFALDVLATLRLFDSGAPGGGRGVTGSAQSRPYGVGHSLGGTALLLAEAMRPGTFAAIYCYEPILLAAADRRPLGSPNPLSEAARRRRASFSSRAEVLERYRSRPPLSSLHPDVLARYVEHGFEDVPDGTVLLRCRPESEALVFESGFASDALDHLDGVLCPVTLATGADSGDLARSGVSHVLERLANGRAVELGGLGHLGPMESPSAVAGSVLAAFAALG